MLKRIAVAALLIIVLVPVALYWSWPHWSSPVLQRTLANYDMELLESHISRPGARSIRLEQIELNYASDTAIINISIPRVTLEYNLVDLLRGRLHSIVTDQTTLTITPLTEQRAVKAAQPSSPVSLPIMLPSELFARSPITIIDVGELVIKSPLSPIGSLQGVLRKQRDTLELNLVADSAKQSRLVLSVRSDNHIIATLETDSQTALRINAQAEVDDSNAPAPYELTGSAEINLMALLDLIQPYHALPEGLDLTGQIKANWHAPLPANPTDLQTKALQIQGDITGGGQLMLSALEASGNFELNGRFQVNAENSRLEFNSLRVNGEVATPEAISALNPRLAKHPLSINAETGPGFTLSMNHRDLRPYINAETARLVLQQQGALFNADIDFGKSSLSLGEALEGTMLFDAKLDLMEASGKDFSAQDLTLKAASAVSITPNKMTLTPQRSASLTIIKLNINNYIAEKINVHSQLDAGIEFTNRAASFADATLSISGQSITNDALELSLPDIQIEVINAEHYFADPNRNNATLNIAVNGAKIRHDHIRLEPLELHSSLVLEGSRISGTFSAQNIHGLLPTRGKLSHNLENSTGEITAITESVVLKELNTYLPKVLSFSNQPVDLTGGKFRIETSSTWNPDHTQLSTALALEDIAGFYGRNLFEGLDGTLTLSSIDDDITITSPGITVTNADLGVQVNNIEFVLVPRDNAILISDFRAELLGGSISQKQLVYEWTQDEHNFVINLHDIQLSEVLKLESGIIGSGSLWGQLPITITDTGVSVKQGGISAKSPGGVLKYDSGEPLTGGAVNAGLQLTLDVLRNFHYSDLTAQVEYEHSGDLELKVTLQGRNPDLEEQRPFRFNLNITENIPTLLKSLQLTREISDDLDQRIRAFYTNDKQELRQ